MDREDFAASVSDTAAMLRALKQYLPKLVEHDLIVYLERLKDDPAGMELLRNAIAPKK